VAERDRAESGENHSSMTKITNQQGNSDVVAVIRAPVEQYPPTLNQISLLSESGLNVTVVDTRHDDYQPAEWRFPDRVRRIHAIEHTQNFKDRSLSTIEKIQRRIRFRNCVQTTIRQQDPSVVIAYDPNAMAAVGKLWMQRHRPRLIWHYHELFLPGAARGGWMTRRNILFAAKHCGNPDLTIFPDRDRAEVYRTATAGSFTSSIVMNCPRRVEHVPEDRLRPALHKVGVDARADIVLFQGWIGPSRCFEAVIRSMKHWPARSHFVLIGPVSGQYRRSLEQLAELVGMSKRVHFTGTVPYQELLSWTVGGDVGVAIVSDAVENDPSWRYTAGAVNKRFEYMSVGLPQIANTGPGMSELIDATDVGVLVPSGDSDEIGRRIARLLSDRERHQQISGNARAAHLAGFSYEGQFEGVLRQIRKWSASADGTIPAVLEKFEAA
jgi:glycosyltransferase involved in cell wall biosynthesis